MPLRPSLRGLLSALLIAFATLVYQVPSASAGPGFQPPSPDELKLTSVPEAPGAAAVILFRQVDRDDNIHTPHEDNYYRIKILTEEGRKRADIEIPFRKDKVTITHVNGRTIHPDGTIVNFDGKAFDKTIVKAKGLKYVARAFTLPEVQVGSIIEYYYTLDFAEYYIFDSHWILNEDLFTKSAVFSLKPYNGGFGDYNVRWISQGLPLGTDPPKEGPDHIVRLASHNIPAFQTEDYMPPENELKGRVDFVYSLDTFEPDSAKFWKKYGKGLNGSLESFVGKQKAMEQAVSQIISASDTPEQKLQKIYARVQQVRNTSYEVSKTEQEEKRAKEKDSKTVEDVWKRGYGDGGDINWLFLALARAAGFEAYGVWASDRRNYFFEPKVMDVSKLDATMVLVKVNGKDVYFDPGTLYTPYGMLEWPETGVIGLRLDKDGGSWVETSLPAASASQTQRTANLKLTDTGDLEGTLKVTFTGLEAFRRRLEERHEDEADRTKFLEDQVKECVPAAVEVELTNRPDWQSSSTPLVAEFSLKVPGWAAGARRRVLVPVGLFGATEKHLFDHANRVHAIYFEHPFERVDDITIELPQSWQVASLPAAQKQDGHVVVYSLSVENSHNALHLGRKLDVDFVILEPKYYSALRNFFQVVRTGDEEQIVLQPGTPSASN